MSLTLNSEIELPNFDETEVRKTASKVLERGMTAASIIINNRCNLACSHCYIYEPERQTGEKSQFFRQINSKEFSRDTALAITRDLKGLAYLITMPAMEPFLSKESTGTALAVAKESSERSSVSIITNATMAPFWLDEWRVKELTDYVEFLSVSIEGRRNLHDQIRGKGNFDRAIRGIEHLVNLGYPGERITLQSCIQPTLNDPFQQAYDVLEIAEALKVGKASFTAFISPTLSTIPSIEDVKKHEEAFGETFRALKRAEEKGIKEKLISIYGTYESPAAVVALNNIIRSLKDKHPSSKVEFNAFETSYFLRHPEFKGIDVRLEVAPLSVEVPCYPRISASSTKGLINITDAERPQSQGAHITRCFAYQVDETPIADWMPGLFPYVEKRLSQSGKKLTHTLSIPDINESIHVDPTQPRTRNEYFEEVLKESIRYNLQKTAFLNQVYKKLNRK